MGTGLSSPVFTGRENVATAATELPRVQQLLRINLYADDLTFAQ
jgi:hypothetical protein